MQKQAFIYLCFSKIVNKNLLYIISSIEKLSIDQVS